MFCIQCEQTIMTDTRNGCSYLRGMCGKENTVSDLQDVLVYSLQGLSFWVNLSYHIDIINNEINQWAPQAFFATLTNVNFDPERIVTFAHQSNHYKEKIESQVRAAYEQANKPLPSLTPAATFHVPETMSEILALAESVAVNRQHDTVNEDIIGLRLLCLYGLKGVAAYLDHAAVLGQSDVSAYAEYHQIMALLGGDPADSELLLQTALRIGALNYRAMALLDAGETKTLGQPEPTQVNIKPIVGKCLLVSGHDLHDLQKILEQTEDKGINVYTHGEMLPGHAYPELKKYSHLVGNYGTAWQNQQREFFNFPGAIVMTSNCLLNPEIPEYADRLFTRSVVGWPNVAHLVDDDFTPAIECALKQAGFAHTEIEQYVTVGFGHHALMAAAPAVIEEIKQGHIKHVLLIGGCDGDKAERQYYHDIAMQAPDDTLILTLGCGKYRFYDQRFGQINGIPRLLDLGQCNDAYSAILLALALAETFECSINDLPLTLILSWFEQKAISILLTLLSFNVKGIYIGPTAPAFLTPNLLAILQSQYDLHLISTPESDLNNILSA